MRVEVAEDKSVGVGMRQQNVEVWSIVGWTRRSWRDVHVIDIERSRIVGDCLNFDVSVTVCDRRGIERGETDVVVDKYGQATAATIRPVPAKNGVVGEVRVFAGRSKLGLL